MEDLSAFQFSGVALPGQDALTGPLWGDAGKDFLTGITTKAALLAEDIKINFQLDAAAVPGGYIKDTGAAYDNEQGQGWVRQDSLGSENHIPLDVRANTRDRDEAGFDQELDTLLHMQYPTDLANSTVVTTPAAWEYALPNGTYSVTVSVGDSAYFDSQHTINVEGIKAIDSFQGNPEQTHKQATVQAKVTDGRLTIDAIGGDNTKINYVEIETTPGTETLTIPVAEDESVYAREGDLNFNLHGSSHGGGLFTGVDGGNTASPARFYLKFDLPELIPGTQVTSATLTGYYNDNYTPVDDGTHGIYFVASDNWSESTITWENQPGQAYGVSEASLDAAKATVGSFINWDITNIVNQEYQGDGVLSLLFHANAEGLVSTNQNWEYFAEKEFDSAKAFRIKLTTEPAS